MDLLTLGYALALSFIAGVIYEAIKSIRSRLRNPRHKNPVEPGMFRMMMLDDNPYPTYIGQRAWCPGTPYWDDKTCKCTHTEQENA